MGVTPSRGPSTAGVLTATRVAAVAACFAGLLFAAVQSGSAARGDLQLALVGNFGAPTYVTAPPGDGTRLFVVEKGGRIRVIRNGAAPTLFLDISGPVDSNESERGLLSMAFPPDYASSGRFYVYYTSDAVGGIANGTLMIVEYRRSAGDPDVADPASGRTLLAIPHPRANHNGGQLQFGSDGYLYVGTGDGGGGGDPDDNGQDHPRVVGLELRTARTRIRRARCRVGRLRFVRSAKPRNRVLSQRPRPRARKAVGTRVKLTVSRGLRQLPRR